MTSGTFAGYSEPIGSLADLRQTFERGEKPREAWRIGTEHEKLGFYRESHRPIPYEGPGGIREILGEFATRFGWEPVTEEGNLIALSRGMAAISLEPGGQLELSGAPLLSVHETCRELRRHLAEIKQITDPLGISWLALGENPLVPREAMPWMPKQRYRIMARYLPTRGARALDMMVSTATVQTNFDYGSEADMVRKMRAAQSLGPFLNSLFANSPFAAGRPTGLLSSRAEIWTATDNDRCGHLPFVYRDDFGYDAYIQYALDVPMFFIHREGRYLDYAGRSFREFMAQGFDGHTATQADWLLHLSTLFPEVRLKNYIELRMCDVGPVPMICALAALTRGLFYDATALDEALLLVRGMAGADYAAIQAQARRLGLRGQALGRPIGEWCREMLAIARGGLRRLALRNDRGETEEKHLEPLERIVAAGKTQADVLLELYEGPWGRRLEPLFTSEPLL
ncbi:MAG: glutamate--cysteine ligase [Candidatus Lambdaproteobacteria bacterium]|nr:glutamate--cysteine ligase [Candidatus Lambdaproteobacteria bacterium]